jgi:hypothetical protein
LNQYKYKTNIHSQKSVNEEKTNFLEKFLAKTTLCGIIFIIILMINVTPLKKVIYPKIKFELSRNISVDWLKTKSNNFVVFGKNFLKEAETYFNNQTTTSYVKQSEPSEAIANENSYNDSQILLDANDKDGETEKNKDNNIDDAKKNSNLL